MRRGALTALAVASLTMTSVGAVRAVSLWTLTASPLAATVGQSTTFDMLAVNITGPQAGCVNVEIPSSFVIQATGPPVASDGAVWESAVAGTWVEVTAVSGLDFLEPGEWVSFSLQLLPRQPGTWNWNNHVHVSNTCHGTAYDGAPVTVVVAPAIVPTPVPTPIPTLIPTLPPLPTPTPRPDPTTTATPAPTATPRPSPSSQPVEIVGTSAPTDGVAPVGRIAELGGAETGSIGLGTDVFALLNGPLVWFVPGAAVGVPGLLVLLWIALQAVGALAWIPAVRRMSGEPLATRRRRRRPARA